jgi:hypothetical protein
MSNILDISSVPLFDNSIEKINLVSYYPFTKQFENSSDITIKCQNNDTFILPSRSYLYIEVSLLDKDNKPVLANNTECKFANMGAFGLFQEIKYNINGQLIERVANPFVSCTIKTLLQQKAHSVKTLENSSWKSEGYSGGKFCFSIPLQKMFGFAEACTHIFPYGVHEIVLTRSKNDQNCIVQQGDLAYSVRIDDIQWKLPVVRPSADAHSRLITQIKSNKPIKLAFRSFELHSQPNLSGDSLAWTVKSSIAGESSRWIVLAFSTDRLYNKNKEGNKFDQCSVSDIKVYLNNHVYPEHDLCINFDQDKYSMLYESYLDFQRTYYAEAEANPLISRSEFKNSPLFVIDCTRQPIAINPTTIDLKVELKLNRALPPKTILHCLTIYDKLIDYLPLTGQVKSNVF